MRNIDNQEQSNTKKNVIITNMDTKLWNKFKGVCYSNGDAMNQVLTLLVSAYVKGAGEILEK